MKGERGACVAFIGLFVPKMRRTLLPHCFFILKSMYLWALASITVAPLRHFCYFCFQTRTATTTKEKPCCFKPYPS